MKTSEKPSEEAWKLFLRRHWKATLLMVAGVAVAAVVAIFVFLGVVADAQATELVPTVLGEWTVGYFIAFILAVIMWELIFVGSWVVPITLIIYFLWYKRLPEKERKEYEGKRRKSAEEGSGISFLCWVIWLIIVWIDGKWNLAFQSWTFNYWVYSWLAACLWTLLIIGVPAIIYIMWALTKK